MESAQDKDYALLRVVTKSPNGMSLVSCIDIFCLYTSSALLNQSECDSSHWPLGKIFSYLTGTPCSLFTVLNWLHLLYTSETRFPSSLSVLPGLTITASQRTMSGHLSRQTSAFSVILTRYVKSDQGKNKNIFAQLRFKKASSLFFYFMCLLVRLVRSSYYRFWLDSRETWLGYNFSGRVIQSATVQEPLCHRGERSICLRSVVKTICSPF